MKDEKLLCPTLKVPCFPQASSIHIDFNIEKTK